MKLVRRHHVSICFQRALNNGQIHQIASAVWTWSAWQSFMASASELMHASPEPLSVKSSCLCTGMCLHWRAQAASKFCCSSWLSCWSCTRSWMCWSREQTQFLVKLFHFQMLASGCFRYFRMFRDSKEWNVIVPSYLLVVHLSIFVSVSCLVALAIFFPQKSYFLQSVWLTG